MKILTKYLGTTIITYILLVILLLTGLQAFIEFTREFSAIGSGNYGVLQVFAYVPMMLPADVYQFFPMAGLLGSVIGLGLLASNSELIVMRASGMSLLDVSWAVIKGASVLIVIMIIIGEVISPVAQEVAIANKTAALSGGQTLVTRQGMWVRSKDNFVHINHVASNGEIQGITRYQFDANQKLLLSSFAESANFKNGQWTFNKVAQTNFTGDVATSENFSQQQWGFILDPHLIGLTQDDPDQKNLIDLYRYIKFRQQSGIDTAQYEFTFWQRIFQPLATIVMIVLAIPFVFGPLRTVTMGLRMLSGVAAGFGFYILNQFVGPMSVVYQVTPFLAAIMPTLIFACLGGFMILRAR